MKIKAFFACTGVQKVTQGQWNITTAAMDRLDLRAPLKGGLNAELPFFFVIQREPNETEGPHKAVVKIFVDDEQPKRQEFDLTFNKGEIACATGTAHFKIVGSMNCRFELSLPGTSELMDWPLQILATGGA